jgi:hypothetical protein
MPKIDQLGVMLQAWIAIAFHTPLSNHKREGTPEAVSPHLILGLRRRRYFHLNSAREKLALRLYRLEKIRNDGTARKTFPPISSILSNELLEASIITSPRGRELYARAYRHQRLPQAFDAMIKQ